MIMMMLITEVLTGVRIGVMVVEIVMMIRVTTIFILAVANLKVLGGLPLMLLMKLRIRQSFMMKIFLENWSLSPVTLSLMMSLMPCQIGQIGVTLHFFKGKVV